MVLAAQKGLYGRNRYGVFDGWNLLAELGENGVAKATYVWGLDLSQSLQGAGGIGGLLTRIDHGANEAQHYFYDGNGNVGQLVDGEDGVIEAAYEYDPFGKIIVATGAYAVVNPFRFATKFLDDEIGIYYYGYRYYLPELGRWVNRDPIGEEGGVNLYTFVLNSPASSIDINGLTPWIKSRTTELVVQILKGLDYLDESYKYNSNTEMSKEVYLKELGDATRKYQKFLNLVNVNGCWGDNLEEAHKKNNQKTKKTVVLTFDDGPGGATEKIISILNENNITGVFFVLGHKIAKNPNDTKLIAANHQLQVHGWTHKNFNKLSPSQMDAQLGKAKQAISDATGQNPTRFRAPFGEGINVHPNSEVRNAARRAGLTPTGWFVDTNDWRKPRGIKWQDVDEKLGNYQEEINERDILMHVYSETANDLPDLILRLRGFGYEFTTY